MARRRVSYYYDNDVGSFSYGPNHPMKPFRMRMTHHLVAAYGMLDKMTVLRPRRAEPIQMAAFHTDEYVDFLSRVTPETAEELTGGAQRYLLSELDNPAFEGLFEFCSLYAGGSLDAAERINAGSSDIAINWSGGLHHAKKREASGFCYVNDIVLCILELLRTFPRVLYIDIDCHHGDGVEEAFYGTDRVLTLSFHKYGEYFPGTGALADRGRGKGLGYSINVPFKDGITDDAFRDIFELTMRRVADWYRPDAIVLQCGADSLAGDKLGCLNISMEGHANCVRFVRALGTPLVLLGGGGYTVKNVARAWTYETACALGVEDEISRDLPFNDYFEWFGPRYRLEVPANNMDDLNKRDGYLQAVKEQVEQHLHDLPFAPSVQLQDVPRQSVAQASGIRTGLEDEDEASLDLDAHIKQFTARAKRRREMMVQRQQREMAYLQDQNVLSQEDTHPRSRSLLNGHSHTHTNGLGLQPTSVSSLIDAKLAPVRSLDYVAERRFFGVPDVSQWEGSERDADDDDEDEDVDAEMDANDNDEDERDDFARRRGSIWGAGLVAAAA